MSLLRCSPVPAPLSSSTSHNPLVSSKVGNLLDPVPTPLLASVLMSQRPCGTCRQQLERHCDFRIVDPLNIKTEKRQEARRKGKERRGEGRNKTKIESEG